MKYAPIKISKKRWFIVIIGLVLTLSLFPFVYSKVSAISAIVPFGGRIISLLPICTAPPGIFLTVGPPRQMSLFYLPGVSFSYPYGPPRNLGQQMLGLAGPPTIVCMVPCPPPALCPAGGGLMIYFHGSSAVF